MMELKNDSDFRGKDVYVDGERVGWLGLGDMRVSHADRRPVTMLAIERGTTRFHENYEAAVAYIKDIYQTDVGELK